MSEGEGNKENDGEGERKGGGGGGQRVGNDERELHSHSQQICSSVHTPGEFDQDDVLDCLNESTAYDKTI